MIKKLGKVKGSLHAKRLDVTKSAEIPILFKEIKKEFGGVDVLVNNAGILKSEFLLSGNISSLTLKKLLISFYKIYTRKITQNEKNQRTQHVVKCY